MREIKFTTNYEPVLSFSDQDFKTKYEERVGNNPGYVQKFVAKQNTWHYVRDVTILSLFLVFIKD